MNRAVIEIRIELEGPVDQRFYDRLGMRREKKVYYVMDV